MQAMGGESRRMGSFTPSVNAGGAAQQKILMNQSIRHNLADHDRGNELHLLAQGILDDLVLRQLRHDKTDQALKSDSVSLDLTLIQAGIGLRRAGQSRFDLG